MISGVLYALLAGLMWGLIFVGPLIVPEYPAMLQSMGRYLALGLIALPIAWLGRVRLRQLARRDWLTALMLTMMGNLIYYFCLASAIQRTGAPVSTMIIGTLPVAAHCIPCASSVGASRVICLIASMMGNLIYYFCLGVPFNVLARLFPR